MPRTGSAETAQFPLAPLRLVEPLDEVEHAGPADVRVRQVLRSARSVISEEKQLSIAKLPQTFPDRLIE